MCFWIRIFYYNLSLTAPSAPVPEVTNPFERLVPQVNYEIIDLPTDGSDLYPPAKVRDLVVTDTYPKEWQAVIQFRATGDDLMQGIGRCRHVCDKFLLLSYTQIVKIIVVCSG